MEAGEGNRAEGLLREVQALRTQVAELKRAAARHEETDMVSIAEREELLREVERVAHLGTWMWDLGSNRVSWSDELYRILGLEPESVPASVEGYYQALHPEDRVRAEDSLRSSVQEGVLPPFEGRLIRPDGSIRHTISWSSSIFDAEGNLCRLVGAVLDRTESLEVEAQLRRALELLEEAQRLARLGNYWHVPETGTAEWSPEFRRILGIPPGEEATAKGFFDRVVPEDVPAFAKVYETLRVKPQRGVVEGRIRRPDGEIRHIRATTEAFRAPSGLIELRGAIQDTTEEVRLREELTQAQKMEAVGRLSAGIAHDFNNLLTVISGNLELLELRTGSVNEIVDSLRALDSAKQLTSRLLAFGRKARLSLVVMRPNELVRSTLTLLRRLVGDQIQLETDLAPGLPCVEADALELERALVNLVINARDVMGEGGIVRITSAWRKDGAYGWVEIGVQDQGPGISESDRPHIFEPFFTTRRESGGTGLGLATVLGTAEQHGGTVRFETNLDGGSTFTIVLPALEGRAPEVQALSSRRPGEEGARLRVLVIDDEPKVAEVTCRMLEMQGHEVVVTTTPEDALSAWSSAGGAFDLVISDISMPKMRGPALVQRLAEGGTVPRVLFITGYSDEETDATRGYPILSKPFSAAALKRAVEDAVG